MGTNKSKSELRKQIHFSGLFATWCVPCKLMDRNVFPQKILGDFVNDKFISVKVQLDTSNEDSKEVKEWYAEAQKIKHLFGVSALPTFLFFSPKGLIVHKGVGALVDTDFFKLVKNALDPEKQYYTLLENYRSG